MKKKVFRERRMKQNDTEVVEVKPVEVKKKKASKKKEAE